MSEGSFIAWVDYSPTERDRMRQAIALFKESDTRDELGLGSIRDTLADLLFPGTSTIQTRLRYFLIVPWLYQELDTARVTSGNVTHRLRQRELDLIEPLIKSDPEAAGVFGAVSGRTVQRLPSSVYWNGLRTWGLLQLDVSQDAFHRAWDEIREHNKHAVVTDDAGVAPDVIRAWDPQMPDPPSEDWAVVASLDVTRKEADYLQHRMQVGECKGSLLAHFSHTRADTAATFPWDAAEKLPPNLGELVYQARAFSQVMHGAAWLYNLGLCRKSSLAAHLERIEEYETALEAWANQDAEVFTGWEPASLWELLAARGVVIPKGRGDVQFVEDWVARVRSQGPAGVANDDYATKLIADRELAIKKMVKARFFDSRARDRWGGRSGVARMDFRWSRVRTLLHDLYNGLERED